MQAEVQKLPLIERWRTGPRSWARRTAIGGARPVSEQPLTDGATGLPIVGRRRAQLGLRAGLTGRGSLVVSTLVLLAVLLMLGTARVSARDEIFPGVVVLDVPVGGLDRATARERLVARVETLAGSPVTLSFDGRRWTPLMSELGISFDARASVDAAMAVGRDHDRVAGLLRATRLTDEPYVVPLAARFDSARFDAYLDQINAEIGREPVDARLAIRGSQVVVTAGQDGVALDHAAARRELLRHLPTPGVVSLDGAAKRQSAAVPVAPVTAAKTLLDRAYAAPMVLRLGDRTWPLSAAELARLTRVTNERSDNIARVRVELDSAGVRTIVDQLAAEADTAPVDARVEDTGTRERLVPAVVGRTVRRDELARAIQDAFQRGVHEVAVPVAEAQPGMTTKAVMADLGITDRLAAGDSDFAGSEPGRATNVRIAAEIVDGTLIPPGGWFSYNRALGAIVEVPGFVPAGVTEGGIPGTSVGGGVCQVSTTVFRAALSAGLPIVEWWPHAYRSPYYEQRGWSAGFDASIFQPDIDPLAGGDLKFANPTDTWMLVRVGIHDGTVITAEVYGAPTGYRVTMDKPQYAERKQAVQAVEQVDPSLPAGSVIKTAPAMDGMTVTVVRHVVDAAGDEIATDTFVSPYEPQGATYKVSPDKVGAAAIAR